jgi:hypothetical protein
MYDRDLVKEILSQILKALFFDLADRQLVHFQL